MSKYKIMNIAILLLAGLSIYGCSNKIDNFAPPNASVSGALIDSKTNDTVSTANNTDGYSFPDGQLQIFQQNYSSTAAGPQGISYNQDGTYTDNALFAGSYKGIPIGAFYADTVLFNISGKTKQDFKVAPFLYVTMQIISSTDSSVTISYQAKSNDSTQLVNEAAAWLSTTTGVNRYSWLGANFNPADNTTYKDDHAGLNGDVSFTRTFSKLQPNSTYYIRAGAIASGNNPLGYWNYSKVYVLQTGK